MARGVHVRVQPTGLEVIAIWSGSIGAIPSGWVLETRLEDLFVRGVQAPGGADLFATGGADSTTLAHDHRWAGPPFGPGTSDAESAHAHSGAFGTSDGGGDGVLGGGGGIIAAGGLHTHPVSGDSTATYGHSHWIEGATDSFAFSIDNRPAFLALAYIRGKAEIPPGAIALYGRAPSTLLPFTAGPRTALASGVGPTDTAFALTVDPGILRLSTAFVGAEQVAIFVVAGTDWRVVARGRNGTTPASHAAGSVVTFPKYAICDGLSGTPFLADSFVIGADGDFALGDTYGTNDLGFGTRLTEHDHGFGAIAVTSTDHIHGIAAVGSGGPTPDGTVAGIPLLLGGVPGAGHAHAIAGQDGPSGGSHAHTMAGAVMPDGTWLPKPPAIPPFVRAYYIQRVIYP